jgi:hypothetical protein
VVHDGGNTAWARSEGGVVSAVMNDSFLDQMQQELVAILKSDEVLGGLPILDERIGDIQKEVIKRWGWSLDVDGKIGLA